MEKKEDPSLFVNDGSFMEKFKQLQQEQQEKKTSESKPVPALEAQNFFGTLGKLSTVFLKKNSDLSSGMQELILGYLYENQLPNHYANATFGVKPVIIANKRPFETKAINKNTNSSSSSGGKLAFSLKPKSKLVTPAVKLSEDDEEERGDFDSGSYDESAKRQKLVVSDVSRQSSQHRDVVPSPPSDFAVKNAADKLACFVAKNGRNFEHVTRQKNPGDTPFKFLYDTRCSNYKYYEYRLLEEEKAIVQAKAQETKSAVTSATASKTQSMSQRNSIQPRSNFQTPASALYDAGEEMRSHGEPPASDPLAMMEYYMKKAAQEERKRPPRQSKDEMPPPASLQATEKKGHHMGDYIPPEELQKFLASCNDAAAQKSAQEAAEKAKIQADNIGHKLLSKMGWREGEGLGSDKSGRADPVMAGGVKTNNLGVGASQPGEVTTEDDIYEQYKKRMMLGYKYRPNPLGNPRKSYY